MNNHKSRTMHGPISVVLALLAIVAIGFAPTHAYADEGHVPDNASQTITGRTVSVADDGRGLDLNLLEGDTVEVEGDTAIIRNTNGSPVATIEATPPQGYKVAYDSHNHHLTVIPDTPFRRRGCTNNKFAQWLVGTGGALMVCLPLGLGVGGLTAGIGGAVAGAVCTAGADGLRTWVSC